MLLLPWGKAAILCKSIIAPAEGKAGAIAGSRSRFGGIYANAGEGGGSGVPQATFAHLACLEQKGNKKLPRLG